MTEQQAMDRLVDKAKFIESQIPNQPQFIKINMLTETADCSKENATLAFRKAWDEMYD